MNMYGAYSCVKCQGAQVLCMVLYRPLRWIQGLTDKEADPWHIGHLGVLASRLHQEVETVSKHL